MSEPKRPTATLESFVKKGMAAQKACDEILAQHAEKEPKAKTAKGKKAKAAPPAPAPAAGTPPIHGATYPVPQEVRTVPIDEIAVDVEQVRSGADEAAVDELAASMRTHGQQVPVRVYRRRFAAERADEVPYRLVYGHRRLAAARRLGWTQVRAEVFPPLNEASVQEMRAVENLQRENLDPVEEALCVSALLGASAPGGDGEDLWRVGRDRLQAVADRLGKSLSWVEARTSVARLSPKVRGLVASRRLPLAHAREIAKLADAGSQEEEAAQVFGCYRFSDIPEDADGGLRLASMAIVRGRVDKRLATLRGIPWRMDVPFAGRPACAGCLDNAANSSLFDTDRPDARCLNLACYRAKRKAADQAVAAAVKRIVPKTDLAATPAAVAKGLPEYVKPVTVARQVAAARSAATPGGGPKKKAGPREIPWNERPEHKLQVAHGKWLDEVWALVSARILESPLRLASLLVVGATPDWQRHMPNWGPPSKAQRKKLDPLLALAARGTDEGFAALSAEVTAESLAGDNPPLSEVWVQRHLAGLLDANLPREPVLQDFIQAAQPRPRAAKEKKTGGAKPKGRKAATAKGSAKAKRRSKAEESTCPGGAGTGNCQDCPAPCRERDDDPEESP